MPEPEKKKVDRGKLDFDKDKFLAEYAGEFGKVGTSKRAALRQLLTFIDYDQHVSDVRWAAYMLATVRHECDDKWRPIEEYGKGSGHPYGKPDPKTGKIYYGRGYVQLTWKSNYQSMGKALGVDLVNHPERALVPSISYRIMSHGMRKGSFTGVKLGDFIGGGRADYRNARKIINGLDRADLIAGYAKKLEKALRAASR
ncbi:MAG TPA: glycoside hydrolase family 19 protein [Pyrinomonadaceae bacterium]|jgi:hypothetical protein